MPKIIFISADETIEVNAVIGETVMLSALIGDVQGIEAECGGGCSCATCHVLIERQWQEKLESASELEQGMLDGLDNVQKNSRLSCQIPITEALDGLIVNVPDYL